jgi:hypothetical protein
MWCSITKLKMCKIDIIKKIVLYQINKMEINKMETEIQEYIKTMNEKELKAYNIAKEHLGMSFQIEKSIGFREWKKKQVQRD